MKLKITNATRRVDNATKNRLPFVEREREKLQDVCLVGAPIVMRSFIYLRFLSVVERAWSSRERREFINY